MQCLNEVRNACAHHSRLWNKALINSPRLKSAEIKEFSLMRNKNGSIPEETRKRLYGALMVINFLMRCFYPATEWPSRLGKLIGEADLPEEVNCDRAGFPNDWRDDPLWFPKADR